MRNVTITAFYFKGWAIWDPPYVQSSHTLVLVNNATLLNNAKGEDGHLPLVTTLMAEIHYKFINRDNSRCSQLQTELYQP